MKGLRLESEGVSVLSTTSEAGHDKEENKEKDVRNQNLFSE